MVLTNKQKTQQLSLLQLKFVFLLYKHVQSKALMATGKPIFFNACEWGVEDPWDWMVQYANSWRSGPDHHDDWESTAKIIEINADKGKYAGKDGSQGDGGDKIS